MTLHDQTLRVFEALPQSERQLFADKSAAITKAATVALIELRILENKSNAVVVKAMQSHIRMLRPFVDIVKFFKDQVDGGARQELELIFGNSVVEKIIEL